jgi:hypothetical protein
MHLREFAWTLAGDWPISPFTHRVRWQSGRRLRLRADLSTIAPQADAPTAGDWPISPSPIGCGGKAVGGSACGPIPRRSRRKRTLLQRGQLLDLGSWLQAPAQLPHGFPKPSAPSRPPASHKAASDRAPAQGATTPPDPKAGEVKTVR